MKITKLTEAQIARFPEFVERWTKIGLCTDPADRPRAEAGVRMAYQAAGLEPPKRIVWCGSPLSQGLTRAIVLGVANGDVKIEQPGDSVWDSVWASVGASVRDSVGDSVRASVWDSVRDSGYGQHDAGWLAFYEYFATACGLSDETKRLCGLWELSRSANWWLPHQNICWVSERHRTVKQEGNRLHCDDGPAVEYPDGWKLWAVRGVLVDEQIIRKPASQTPEQIRAEQNLEVKRIRIERFGWPEYLKIIGAKRLDARRNDIEGTREALYRAEDMAILVCVCPSTAKVFSLEVPSQVVTCEQAQRYLSSGLNSRIISAA